MDYEDRLIEHYVRAWGQPVQATRLLEGHIERLPKKFRVLVFQPASAERVFATCWMSPPGEGYRLELHLRTRAQLDSPKDPVMLLHAVTAYHCTGAELDLHHSVNFGQPWQPGSLCTRGFITLPFLDGPELEWMEEPEARCLWLIPVTEAEVEFKKSAGVEALEQLFEERQFSYLDPRRSSVV